MTSHATDSGLLAPVWAGTGAAEATSDHAWVRAMLDVEVALARAQAKLGIIPAAAAERIAAAADPDRIDLVQLAEASRGAANPVVVFVQLFTALIEPAAAEYVHRGSTSQDILDSATMLLAARAFRRVEADLTRAATAVAGLAREYRDTPMAGRTLTQHAVPITFGLKAAGWLTLVLDARDRVRHLLERGLPAQLGGAAGTLSAYAEYATAATGHPHTLDLLAGFSAQLGLPEPVLPWHAVRTPIADLGATAAFVTGALGKIAVDVQGMSRTEVGEVAEPSAEGRGQSSAMPQKRNPVLATLILAAARQTPALSSILTQCLISEDERAAGAWHAEWQPLREVLRLTIGAAHTAAELVTGLEVFPDRLRANLALSGGTIVSERLNVALAPVLGKAPAKKLLARISLASAATGIPFGELLAAAPELAGKLTDVAELLDPARYLGAAGDLVDRALARAD
ncbi:3-carboxy-cis,cis-muconate cycloisomerase [Crossiella cryophila]|uniref:3-carboxy-cis,cis-muconate cycloisomerase n=1 Tax=Crossiella cryophila TaxID=43355 RepID=A0A7W7FUD2_9PSEU|nr:3-carboxy-cis,cis-muconate cycloisomerase [Crossiella cryophila]MBB4678127.1 3-carboxy-cis,cis-muconate cycloisomerase [Crossiella cryophila]